MVAGRRHAKARAVLPESFWARLAHQRVRADRAPRSHGLRPSQCPRRGASPRQPGGPRPHGLSAGERDPVHRGVGHGAGPDVGRPHPRGPTLAPTPRAAVTVQYEGDAARCTAAILRAFESYLHEFRDITRRAALRHQGREWQAIQKDARHRLDLHPALVGRAVIELGGACSAPAEHRARWIEAKRAYGERIADRADYELAQTFFNSVTRRLLTTVGVDPAVEFVEEEYDRPRCSPERAIFVTYAPQATTAALVHALLGSRRVAHQPITFDAASIAEIIDRRRRAAWGAQPIEGVDVLEPVFYRNKGAYLIGRIRGGGRLLPLVIALVSDGARVVVDAVLLTED